MIYLSVESYDVERIVRADKIMFANGISGRFHCIQGVLFIEFLDEDELLKALQVSEYVRDVYCNQPR